MKTLKAKDLRVGNYIQVEYEGELQVVNINSQGFDYVDCKRPNYNLLGRYEIEPNVKPIPLTEEWLVKFGFEVVKKDWTFATHKTNIEFTINNAINGDWRFTPIWCTDYSPILSVHQLQNLYFSLTGEELTIN